MAKDVKIKITADGASANKTLNGISASITGLEKVASKAGSGISMSAMTIANFAGNVLTKAFNALASSMDGAIKRFDTMNNFGTVMSNLGQSAQTSSRMVQVLGERLTGLPTRLDEAAGAVQRLTSANENVEASTAIYLAMNDAILAGGASMDVQKQALDNLVNSYAKGNIESYTWEQLLTAMPAQMSQLAKSFGYTSNAMGGDFYNAVQNGTVSMNELVEKMVELDNVGGASFKAWRDAAFDATAGVQTNLANLKNAFVKLGTAILDTIGPDVVNGAFSALISAVKTATAYVTAFVSVLMKAAMAVFGLFGGQSKAKQFSDAVASAGSATSKVSSGSGQAAKNLGKAASNAKKLTQQLAGFDEMNVLKEPASGGGGSGGKNGGGGGIDVSGIDLSGLNVDLKGGSKLADELAEKFGYLQQVFESVFGTLKEVALKAWAEIQKIDWATIARVIGGVIEIIIRYYGGLATAIIAIWNAISPVVEAFVNTMKSRITPVFDILIKAINKVAPVFQKTFKPIVDMIGRVVDKLTKFLAPALELVIKIFSAISPLVVAVGGAIEKAIGWVIDAFDTLVSALDGIDFDGIFTPLANVLTTLTDALSPLVSVITVVFGNMLNQIVPIINEMIAVLMPFIQQLVDELGTYLMPILGEIFTQVGNLVTALMPIFQELLPPLAELIGVVAVGLMPALELIGQLIANIMKVLNPIIQVIVATLVPILQALITLITEIINVIMTVLNVVIEVIGGIIDVVSTFIGNILQFFADCWSGIMNVFSGVIDFFHNIFNGAWNAVKGVWEVVRGWFANLWDGVKNVFDGAWNALKTGAQNAWNAIKNIFSTVASFFGTIFTNAWNSVKAVFSTGGKIFMGIVDGIANAFKQIVNAIIGGINRVVAVPFNAINGMLNRIRGIDIAGIKPFEWIGTISVPQIPKLARGGIVDEATIAMVGESGREAVIPLEDNTEWIEELAEQLGGSNQQIVVMIGEDTVVDTIVDKINARTSMANRSIIRV